jgi:hypothetical protein
VFIAVTPAHVAGPQMVLTGYFAQEPNPSQVPVVPQLLVACSAHSGWRCPWAND